MDFVKIKNVHMKPSFLSDLMDKVADGMIPYQWQALNDLVPDAAPSYCMRNLRAAAGEIKAPHGGCVFQDSDLAKWIEAASYTLAWKPDPKLEEEIDEAVRLMEKAQLPDGYLNTYYQLTDITKRFTNLRDHHELYCAGHLLEAACAYYEVTGKRRFLDVMERYVDLIDRTFGPEDGKLPGYPGHEEIELALVKLYSITQNEKHLKLAKFFIDQRGQGEGYFNEEAVRRGESTAWDRSVYSGNRYYQAHMPVRQQNKALGHAVRQLYLLCGMADVARETQDEALLKVCREMWKDVTRRQMYITGAVGQSAYGEAFTFDYDLPNDSVYGETCASIALFFFALRMMKSKPLGEYGDICDTLLYNGTISGMNESGDRFFYVNPLECVPERSEKSQPHRHIRPSRQKWFGCACCPPNLARMIANLPACLFLHEGSTAYMNLFSSCEAEIPLEGGCVRLACETKYPWDGKIALRIKESFPGFRLALRLPRWVKTYELTVNGKTPETVMDEGFVYLEGLASGDEIVYDLHMPVQAVSAHPRVTQDAGLIAVRRGPVVYCLEEADNGKNLSALALSRQAEFRCEERMGAVCVSAPARRLSEDGWDEYELYASDRVPVYEDVTARFIPYYLWNNRGEGEMRVWVRALS
ncbi:MAG: glycoside hydrolase family 127 protein [Clostridia bacterium]|nr:glycoside hydrolase family 127 protein [Clostridia bacterium]